MRPVRTRADILCRIGKVGRKPVVLGGFNQHFPEGLLCRFQLLDKRSAIQYHVISRFRFGYQEAALSNLNSFGIFSAKYASEGWNESQIPSFIDKNSPVRKLMENNRLVTTALTTLLSSALTMLAMRET